MLVSCVAVLAGCAGRGTRDIEGLLRDLMSESESARRRAERNLAEHGRSYIKPLSNILTGQDIEKTVHEYDIKAKIDTLKVPAARALGVTAERASLARSEAETAAKPLLQVLHEGEDLELRVEAAQALGCFTQLSEPANDLILLLRVQEPSLVQAAIDSLARNALQSIDRLVLPAERPAEAVEKDWERLERRIQSADDEIRLDTVREIAASRDPRAADLLIQRLGAKPPPDAARPPDQTEEPADEQQTQEDPTEETEAEEAEEDEEKPTKDKSKDVRYAALVYCRRVAKKKPNSPFAQRLYAILPDLFRNDDDSRVVLIAAQMLRDREPDLVGEFLHRVEKAKEKAEEKLLADATNDEYDAGTRADAISALRSLPSPERDKLLAGFLDPQEDEAPRVKRAAASVLTGSETETARQALELAMQDEDSIVRLIAAQALGRLGNDEAVRYLIALLSHKEAKVRPPAADALGTLREEALDELTRQLQTALDHAETLAQWEVPLAELRRVRDRTREQEHRLDDLEDAIEDYRDEHPRRDEEHIAWGIVSGLGDIAAEIEAQAAAPARGAVVRAIGCHYPSVRIAAAEALAHFEGPQVIEALREALGDPNEDVRWYAARSLEAHGKAAIPALAAALDDERSVVDAAHSLVRIGAPEAIAPIQARLDQAEGPAREALLWAVDQLEARRSPTP
ncbi:MAG: HEAT repeat domain-containing protein [Candidatus Brocadiia bacterium]